MCGIAGAIGGFSPGIADQIVRSMAAALTHRGPDDSGSCCWVLDPHVVALGNTRLSILDLSAAGHQPMAEQSGRYSTVFNGEIYNFKELRKLLDPENCRFRTSSDTEVILHAYHRWSEKAFQAFRGMFAFALLDRTARKVYLVRDPLGIKPLYFHISGGKVLFASEVQALLASGAIERRIETEAVSHFLSYGWVGGSNTAIAGIKLLQPGQMLSVDLGRETINCKLSTYAASIPVVARASDSDRNEASAHMFHLLAQSVKCHLTSDVPVGLFLSGGIDSTVLLHLMREAGCARPKTFTVAFADKRFNENQIAKQIARRYEAEHHNVEIGESSLLADLPCALTAMDQPTMDGVNTFVIAKAVRSAGVKVALSGLGGDELFAGYPSFRRARWARRAAKIPPRLRGAIGASCRRAKLTRRQEKAWHLLESDCTPLATYRISRRLFGPAEINSLIPGTAVLDDLAPFPSSGDDVNDISRLELTGYMTGLLLRDTDFMSMANSLEVRVPFIDRAVVDHALRLPGHWKLAPSVSKALLLDAMKGALPSYVWKRPKMGFVIPFELWMRTSLRAWIEETFGNRRLAAALGFSTQGLEELWRAFLKGHIRWSKPWSLFVLLRWCELQRACI
jgi:asparagine synthase (glutamine-hydrolysing)